LINCFGTEKPRIKMQLPDTALGVKKQKNEVGKWSINQYYSRKLPDGQAFPVRHRKNPGSGEYDIKQRIDSATRGA
jgi:hypothetical protein